VNYDGEKPSTNKTTNKRTAGVAGYAGGIVRVAAVRAG
jgi:hypothetical protein